MPGAYGLDCGIARYVGNVRRMEKRVLRPEDIVVFNQEEESMLAALQARIDEALHETRGDAAIMISNTPPRVVHEIARVYERTNWDVYLTGRAGDYELRVRHPSVSRPNSFELMGDGLWVAPRGAIKYEGTKEKKTATTDQ